jgi:methylated-DNA-protein-cysteine methyltransferase-like protein
VAALAGRDRQARLVGYALAALEDLSDVPWHRVVNARGEISRRQTQSGAEQEQYLRLVSEGVVFSPAGRISLARCQWRSGASG